jgi:hypothetical protein
MSRLPTRPLSDAAEVLTQVIARIRSVESPIVAFDLDSTLLDNRPRSAHIFRELGESISDPVLLSARPEHFVDWSLERALRSAGANDADVARLAPQVLEFWRARFFTSQYCRLDVATPGAPTFVKAVLEAGGGICYLTGRDETMRAGTLQCFETEGFPSPDGQRVRLIMKPQFELSDDEFKRTAHQSLPALGRLVAAFDNEPTHANDYAVTFPDALVVHMATDHSGRPIDVLAHIPSILDFTAHPAVGDARATAGPR